MLKFVKVAFHPRTIIAMPNKLEFRGYVNN